MPRYALTTLVLLASCASSEPQVPKEFAKHYKIKAFTSEERGDGTWRDAVIESTDERLLPGRLIVSHLACRDGTSCLTVTYNIATMNLVDHEGDGRIDVLVSSTCSADRTIWTRREGWKRLHRQLTDVEREALLERGQRVYDTCMALLGVKERKD